MRVAVIGASGRTGRPLTHTLLDRGHEVVALVRDPARLHDVSTRVEFVTGNSTDPVAVKELVNGADVVVSALGPTAREATLHRDTARALVQAMTAAGVRRFVGVSGAGIDVPGDQKAAKDKVISFLIQHLGGAVVADKPAEYRVWADSGLEWTLVRPPRLVDGAAAGRLEHDAHRSTRSSTISRADLATFLVDVLEQGLYVRQAPFVARSR